MTSLRLILLAALASGSIEPLYAQTPAPGATGRVVGRIIEETTGAPIPGAQVGVAAGGAPVTSAIDGRYILLNLPAGPTAVAVRAIGYAPKTVSGVVVPPGGAAALDITLAPQAVQLGEITVAAEVERGSVAAALDEQRHSNNVVNAITAEQIARSPDSDAGQAVQRVSGVTVQDGRYVFVRGLGERYTTTSLNGSRIPSPEPERKVV
ncbi:MAG: carboxypeptidase regulatory-like domain-containing protein, partial [Gemmatimonadota bacterium]